MTDGVERWQRGAAVLWRVSGDRLMLKEASDDDVVVLGPTGVAVWEELVEPTALAEMALRMSVRFGVEAAAVEADLGRVLSDLHARSLVRRCP